MTKAGFLERRFDLAKRGSNPRTELLAGATTFFTMAYIVLVNPAILGQAGLPVAAVAVATCLAAGFASILMGFVANVPLALAPGMGLNAYFAYTVVLQLHIPWQQALACVFVSGIAFLVMTALGLRQMILSAIPQPLFAAVAAGIGLFIGFIGLKNAGVVVANPATFVSLGDLRKPDAALALFGLLVMAVLSLRKVQGAILIGIVVTTAAAALLGMIHYHPQPYDIGAIRETAFKLDFAGLFGKGGPKSSPGIGLVEILFVFLFVDLFDNIGTLVGVTKRAGLMKQDGTIPGLNRILLTDSIATLFGSLCGTSTVTSYVESAAGVEAGGRTGLTAVITGVLFLLTMFVAPYAQLIPVSATAPALVIVGALMMAPLAEIDWGDPLVAIPAFLTVATIPLSFSIANGIAFGLTAFAALKLAAGKANRGDALLMILAVLFVARFIWLSAA
jgi:AGZA family xanthine/uracil permease-like MFS transporter